MLKLADLALLLICMWHVAVTLNYNMWNTVLQSKKAKLLKYILCHKAA